VALLSEESANKVDKVNVCFTISAVAMHRTVKVLESEVHSHFRFQLHNIHFGIKTNERF